MDRARARPRAAKGNPGSTAASLPVVVVFRAIGNIRTRTHQSAMDARYAHGYGACGRGWLASGDSVACESRPRADRRHVASSWPRGWLRFPSFEFSLCHRKGGGRDEELPQDLRIQRGTQSLSTLERPAEWRAGRHTESWLRSS